jgi:PAS domain S-box-containing protein
MVVSKRLAKPDMPAIRAQNVAIRGSRLGGLLEEFPHAATVANADNRLVFVNRAFSSLYGWEEMEVLGLTPRLMASQDHPEANLREIRQAISSASFGWCGQLENVTKTGRRFLARVWAARVKPDASLPHLYYLGLAVPVDSGLRPEEDLTSRLAGTLLRDKHIAHPGTQRLTRAEQIANFRSLGYSTKEIATILGVEPNTINVALHRERRRAGRDNEGDTRERRG